MSILLWCLVILAAWLLVGVIIALVLGAAVARNERACRGSTAEAEVHEETDAPRSAADHDAPHLLRPMRQVPRRPGARTPAYLRPHGRRQGGTSR